jgi:hypothetical protein
MAEHNLIGCHRIFPCRGVDGEDRSPPVSCCLLPSCAEKRRVRVTTENKAFCERTREGERAPMCGRTKRSEDVINGNRVPATCFCFENSTYKDAVQGITAKFRRPYEGPYHITKMINPSTREISDPQRNLREHFIRGF